MRAKILSTKQVCEIANRSPATLKRWWKAGHFPRPIQHQGRTIGWNSKAVDEWLHSESDRK